MNEPAYYVLVFGDPQKNGDRVESGRYEAGEGYAPFAVAPGDILLLYCTEGYSEYSLGFPGIGVVVDRAANWIAYRWIPFSKPIQRKKLEDTFAPDDQKKMGQLRFNTRRVFEISRESFLKTVTGEPIFPLS